MFKVYREFCRQTPHHIVGVCVISVLFSHFSVKSTFGNLKEKQHLSKGKFQSLVRGLQRLFKSLESENVLKKKTLLTI